MFVQAPLPSPSILGALVLNYIKRRKIEITMGLLVFIRVSCPSGTIASIVNVS